MKKIDQRSCKYFCGRTGQIDCKKISTRFWSPWRSARPQTARRAAKGCSPQSLERDCTQRCTTCKRSKVTKIFLNKLSSYVSISIHFLDVFKNGSNFSATKKKMLSSFKRASGWLAVGSFSFWYRTREAIGRKRHAEYDVRANMIEMWAAAPGPVGSSHPREERTSRKKVSGQWRVPGVIKITFLAFLAAFWCILGILSILGIFFDWDTEASPQPQTSRLKKLVSKGC